MRFSIERADGGEEPAEQCLVRTPSWDFNWQRFYGYDLPIDELPTASGGDVIRVKCTYDNSLSNPLLKTLDEMCLGALGILLPNLN